MFIVEIADKFRHTWLMTVIDTCFQKIPPQIKSVMWSKTYSFHELDDGVLPLWHFSSMVQIYRLIYLCVCVDAYFKVRNFYCQLYQSNMLGL